MLSEVSQDFIIPALSNNMFTDFFVTIQQNSKVEQAIIQLINLHNTKTTPTNLTGCITLMVPVFLVLCTINEKTQA